MQGFIERRTPPVVRRAVTILPRYWSSLRLRPRAPLVLSQVVLSLGIPFTWSRSSTLTAPPTSWARW